MASNIPTFASFRPKPKDPAQPDKEPTRPDRPDKSHTISREKKSRGKARPKETSRHQLDSQSREHDAAPSNVFFSDRRGDRDIEKYGTFNKYDIPAYRAYGYGHVLGLSRDWKIDRDRSTDTEVVIMPPRGRRPKRLLADKHPSRDNTRAIKFIKVAKTEDDPGADFIALSATGKRKHEDDEQDEWDDYRRLDRDALATKPSDPDAEYESETVDSTYPEVTQRNAALVRRTREHPEDLDAWLHLIHHQEEMMKIERSSSELTSSDKQNLADIRISAYEQALKKMSRDGASQVKLYSGLMKEASRSWDEGRLAKKWSEILAVFPYTEELWTQYLDFAQSSFTGFRYETCRATFSECFKKLQQGPAGEHAKFILHVLLRLTMMTQQAGYQELALATWQALLEFHLLEPKSSPAKSLGEKLRSFEEFWDSEAARIGEEGASGWANFNEDIVPPALGPDPSEAPATSAAVTDEFCEREVDNMHKLRYPGRTTDEIGEDDPFHTVLFSDVEHFLRLLPPDTNTTFIVDVFLCFCGLPRTIQQNNNPSQYQLDPFLQSTFVVSPSDEKNPDTFAQIFQNYSSTPIQHRQMTTELLFNQAFPSNPDIINTTFVRRVLKSLTADDSADESLGEYLLAFESNYFPHEAHKTAKKLLKARPTSLRLYNAYALAESKRGNSLKADQVFSAALSMQKGGMPFSTPGSLELFSNWMWNALRQGQNEEALSRLVCPTGQIPAATNPEQAAILRTRTVLAELSERSLLGDDTFTAVMSTSLSALLAYLSSGEKPESALSTYGNLTKWFTDRQLSQSPAAELHAQAIARFLAHHATHARIVKPSLLRTSLEPLIACFPNNTILLSLYATNEARFSIDDRVRDMMHRNILANPTERSIISWTFLIHYETLRGSIVGSTSHSIRALYFKAEDDIGAHCPALWKQHVLFEMAEARKESAKRPSKKPRKDEKKRKERNRVEEAYRRVREVFLRGVTCLPWCKDFMMLAFTHLGDEFLGEEERRKVYNAMVEKELRLYVELEDGEEY
ncbi:DUF1740-domain-containing protein [Massarina eburnea CBS 473.64]|uniref:DUF1740-domain-containing protein n=1 Tax=Massarina eburnea CBS 473.64 TaxID=1395130 RepID=A0A6A6S2K6_9PLEO|nr:DUF1740-domain-containing protein [Massarina eburnea CBS 473.64]